MKMKILKGLKYCFDKIVELVKIIIEASNLSFNKIKLLFFTCFMGIFAFNYFIEYSSNGSDRHLEVNPQDTPISVILTIASLIVFLIFMDLIYLLRESARLHRIIENSSIPKSIREKAAEKLFKLK
jgi:hypothetical protein